MSRLIIGHWLALVAGGLAVGMVASLLAGHGLSTFLYQVAPADPLTLGSVVGLLATVAAIAMAVPARRATRIDPAAAIRAD